MLSKNLVHHRPIKNGSTRITVCHTMWYISLYSSSLSGFFSISKLILESSKPPSLSPTPSSCNSSIEWTGRFKYPPISPLFLVQPHITTWILFRLTTISCWKQTKNERKDGSQTKPHFERVKVSLWDLFLFPNLPDIQKVSEDISLEIWCSQDGSLAS